jgi:hypothetical protein
MRISEVVVTCSVIGIAISLAPATAFDGKPVPESAPLVRPHPGAPAAIPLRPHPGEPAANPLRPHPGAPATASPVPLGPPRAAALPAPTPFEAFRSGTQALRAGKTDQAVTSLEYAAQQGVAAAQWKLGRMYADGDGVSMNKLRAFEYFKRIASEHADETPGTPRGMMVANAFVALGHFYRDGIPDSPVRADAGRARHMFWYAASYFADSEAQYNLGRLYLDGNGAPKDPVQAARWFRLSANKGHHLAQATLGSLLFEGKAVARQGALGLFWLIVAKDAARPDERWINDTYESAMARATPDEQAMAYRYLENWIRGRQ